MSFKDSPRLFKNDRLERFTHVHPVVPALVWIPFVCYLLGLSFFRDGLSVWQILSMALPGIFVWSLMEYLLHRFVFHLPDWGPLTRKIEFFIHGVHHEHPNDKTRLLMPPVGAVVIAIIFFQFFRLFLDPVWVIPFFAFFLVGYLIYDYTHYYLHHFSPRTRFGKQLKHNHMTHHYAAPNSRWGVSSPLWDLVFGTYSVSVSDKEHVA